MSNEIKRVTGLLVIEVVNSNPNGTPIKKRRAFWQRARRNLAVYSNANCVTWLSYEGLFSDGHKRLTNFRWIQVRLPRIS